MGRLRARTMGFFAPSRLATLGVRSVLAVADDAVAGGVVGEGAGDAEGATVGALLDPASLLVVLALLALLAAASAAPASLARTTAAESGPASLA